MVSAHTERLLKAPLWTFRAQTMTRASEGPDGSVMGRWWVEKQPHHHHQQKKKGGRRFLIMVKSVKYFDMSHTPWCSSSWAFCLSAGGTIDFLHVQVVCLPASRRKTFHDEPWLAIAAVPLGFFPWTPWIKTLWGRNFSCVASQVSPPFSFLIRNLAHDKLLSCCFFVGPELAWAWSFFSFLFSFSLVFVSVMIH